MLASLLTVPFSGFTGVSGDLTVASGGFGGTSSELEAARIGCGWEDAAGDAGEEATWGACAHPTVIKANSKTANDKDFMR